MKKTLFFLFLLLPSAYLFAQLAQISKENAEQLAPLTVEKIMRNPQWIGTSPSNVFWSPDSKTLYFDWNSEHAVSDSLYFITLKNHSPQLATPEQRQWAEAERRGNWNDDRTKLTFKIDHAIYVMDLKGNRTKVIESTARIYSPRFGVNGTAIVYRGGNNLFAWNRNSGATTQLTNFKKGHKPSQDQPLDGQEAFLKSDALQNSVVLRQRKKKREARKEIREMADKDLPPIYIGSRRIRTLSLSPDGNFVVYSLVERPQAKHTIVPDYVTESGYTKDIPGRTVVGVEQPHFENYIYDRQKDTVLKLNISQIPGIRDIPKFIKAHYPDDYAKMKKENALRSVYMSRPIWNKKGARAFVVIRALDHKDRWLMLLNVKNGALKPLERQHDDAWIGGPGIGYPYSVGNVGWIDAHTIWYQSEQTGYSHLYALDIDSGKETALTSGKFEVQDAQLSPDHRSFYITANKVEPGQKQFYILDISSKKLTRITQKTGGYQVSVSPDGNYLASLFSTSVDPWELYLQRNKPGAKEVQITHKAESAAYRSYPWRKPEIFTFVDRDGFKVYAEVYRPEQQAASRPGVVFVHGAGYLQDVKRYWSYYFREHMFMNLLADKGYTVLSVDYRGSAGYGRDWRTAIYRHMGGNDLEDVVDGARYMVRHFNVNPENIGIWGGSYGGFMTLMAMFKTTVFKSGGALRSVTDWAHYNHGYTSDILNLPQNDSIAYVRSSPIYFAEGLQGHLLMCHGMVDTNVHFQDIVRLTQRLIELGKKNWELAVYPVESHAFVEASSWTDEYRRIYELFEKTLK